MGYFGRVYRLEIGGGAEARVFDGFPGHSLQTHAPAQIKFTVEQAPATGHSYAEITLYGLNAESRRGAADKFEVVRLTAGYLNKFGVIFNGKIANVVIGREGPESFVKLFCKSAAVEWGTPFINQAFGAGTPQIDIIRAVAATLGMPVEIIGDFSQLPRAIRGDTISRGSVDAMWDLARRFKFSWMVENEQLIIIKHGATRGAGRTFKYSAETGLIGSPEMTDLGINAKVMLSPLIRPWDLFEVEAETGTAAYAGIYAQRRPYQPTGQYQAVSLIHEGDFHGDRWQTEIKGRRPQQA